MTATDTARRFDDLAEVRHSSAHPDLKRLLEDLIGESVPTDPITGHAIALWDKVNDLATRLGRLELGFPAEDELEADYRLTPTYRRLTNALGALARIARQDPDLATPAAAPLIRIAQAALLEDERAANGGN